MFQSRSPIGEPLSNEVLAAMGAEERSFWNSFLQLAKDTLDAKEAERRMPGEKIPAPAELARLYHEAIEKHDGGKYCQVRQLEQIFDFGSPCPA